MAKNDLRSTILTEHRKISTSRYILAIINFIAVLIGTLVTLYFVGMRGAPSVVITHLYILLGINVAQLALCLLDYALKNFFGTYMKYLPIVSYAVAALWVIVTISELIFATSAAYGVLRRDLLGIAIIQLVVSLVAYLVWPMMDRMAIDAMIKQSVREDDAKREKIAKSYVLRYALLCVFIVVAQVGSLLVYKIPPKLYDLFAESRAIEYVAIEQDGREIGYTVKSVYAGKSTLVNIPAKYNNLPVLKIASNALVEDEYEINKIEFGTPTKDESGKIVYESYIQTIEAGAISNNHIESIVIPNSVTELGENAIKSTSLKELTLSTSLKKIGAGAITCSALEELVIPESVTELAKGAITCDALKEVSIPEAVTVLADGAIVSSALEELHYSAKANFKLAYFECENLETVYIENENVGGIGAIQNLGSVSIQVSQDIYDEFRKNNMDNKDNFTPILADDEYYVEFVTDCGDYIGTYFGTIGDSWGLNYTSLQDLATETGLYIDDNLTVGIENGAKPGYAFRGWYYDREFKNECTFSKTEPVKFNQNTTLYAKWTTQYTGTLDWGTYTPNERDGIKNWDGESEKICWTDDRKIDFPVVTDRKGYAAGVAWTVDDGMENISNSVGISENVILHAAWTLDNLQVELITKLNDGTPMITNNAGVFTYTYDEALSCILDVETTHDIVNTVYAPNMPKHEYKYKWSQTKGNGFNSSAQKSISLKNVVESGTYELTVTLETPWGESTQATIKDIKIQIDKKDILLGDFMFVKTPVIYTANYQTMSYTGDLETSNVSFDWQYKKDGATYDGKGVKDAGEYDVTLTLEKDDAVAANYNEMVLTTKYTVLPKQLVFVEWKGSTGEWTNTESIPSIIYDGKAKSYEMIVDGRLGADVVNVVYEKNSQTATNSGSYTTRVAGVDNSNYALDEILVKQFAWEIAPREIKIASWSNDGAGWSGDSVVYDGNTHSVSAVMDGVIDGESVTLNYAIDASNEGVNVGSYTSKVSGINSNDNYWFDTNAANNIYTWNIIKRTLTVSYPNVDYTYNAENQVVKALINNVVAGDLSLFSLDCFNLLNSTYELAKEWGNVSEGKLVINFSAKAAGDYKASIALENHTDEEYSFLKNYTLELAEKTFAIKSKEITIKKANATYTYTGETQELPIVVSGIYQSDLASFDLDMFTTDAVSGRVNGNNYELVYNGKNAGAYEVSVSAFDYSPADVDNYVFSTEFEDAITINKKKITLKSWNITDQTPGKADATFTLSRWASLVYNYYGYVVEDAVVDGFVLEESFALTYLQAEQTDVNTYTTTATFTHQNYEMEDTSITWSIIPFELTFGWEVDGKVQDSFIYDGKQKQVSPVVITEMPGNDTQDVLSISYTVGSSERTQVDVGSYTYRISELGNANYKLKAVTGEEAKHYEFTFEITKKEITIDWMSSFESYVYSGAYQGPQFELLGIVERDEGKMQITSRAYTIGVGGYKEISFEDNYVYTNDKGFAVDVGTYNIRNFVLKKSTDEGLSYAVDENYTIVAGDEFEFTITPKKLFLTGEWTFTNSSRGSDDYDNRANLVYNTKTYKVETEINESGILSRLGEKDVLQLTYDSNEKVNADEYVTNVTGVSGLYAANYELDLTNGKTLNWVIAPKEIDVQWSELDKTYNSQAQTPIVNIEMGATADDDGKAYEQVAISLEYGTQKTKAGNYVASVDVASMTNTNYTLATDTISKDWVINPYVVDNLTWSTREFIYNAQTQAPTASYEIHGIEVFAVLENTDNKNVGSYRVTASGTNNENYVLSEAFYCDYQIKAKEITLSWAVNNAVAQNVYTYDGNEYAVIPTAVGVCAGDAVALTYEDNTYKNAGEYTITVTGVDNNNYYLDDSNNSWNITVNKKVLTFAWYWDDATVETVFTYDGNYHTLHAEPVGVVVGDDVELIYETSSVSEKNVNTYTATVRELSNANYMFETGYSKTLTIKQQKVRIEWTGSEKFTYDGMSHATAVNVYGADDNKLIYTNAAFATHVNANTSAESFTLRQDDLNNYDSNNSNYTLVNPVSGSVTRSVKVDQRIVEIAWSVPENIVYDGNSYSAVATVTNLYGDDSVSLGYKASVVSSYGSISANANSAINAGEYTVSVNSLGNSNYTLAGAQGVSTTLSIAKQQVVITWSENTTFTYNATVQVPEVTVVGKINTSFNVPYTKSAGNTNAGENYTAEVRTVTDTNYTLDGVANKTVNYTIEPQRVKITWSNTTFTYNGYEQVPTATVVGVTNTNVNVTYTKSAGNTNAGVNYTAEILSVTNPNYTLDGAENTSVSYTINPQKVTLEWTGTGSKEYSANKNWYVSATAKGTERGQTISINTILDTPIDSQSYQTVGTYSVMVNSLESKYASNFTLDGVQNLTGSVTIVAQKVNIAWGNLTTVYTGNAQAPTPIVTGSTDGHEVGFNLTNAGYLVNANSYTVGLQLTNANYTLSGVANTTATYKIEAQQVKITWTNQTTFVYNGYQQGPTATVVGAMDGKNVPFSVSADNTNAGSYEAKVLSLSNSNYTLNGINNVAVNYTILPQVVTILWSNVTTFTYDGLAKCPNVSVTGEEGEAVDFVMPEGAVNADDHSATITTLRNANYTLEGALNKTVSYTILPQAVSIEWSGVTTFVYDGTSKLPTVTVKGATDGKTVEHTVLGAQTNAGENYTATVVLNNTNYTLEGNSNVSTSFEILPQDVIVTVTSATVFTYNGQTQVPTVTVTSALDTLKQVSYKPFASKINAGEYSVAIELLDNNYTINGNENATISYVILPQAVEIIWSESKVFTYNGEAQAPTVTVKGKDDQNELFGFTVTAGNVNVGNYTATVTDLNNDNYTLVGNANVSTSYEIVAQEVVVAVEGSNSLTYNGTPQAPTVTVKGSLDGMDVAFEALQGAKKVGSYSENVVLTDSNYTIREEDKTVAYQIVAKELTIKWTLPDGEKADGKAKTVKVVAEGMVSGENYELVVTITNEKGQVVTNVTEAGTYTVTVTAANNASQNYSIASATKTATFTIEEA